MEMTLSDEQYKKIQRVLSSKQMNDIFGEDDNYWFYNYSHIASLSGIEEELIVVKKLVSIYNSRIRALERVRKENFL